MPKSEHGYYLMKGIPKDADWWVFTQLMYDKIDTLADKPEEVIRKMKSHEVRHQQEVDFESIELLPLAKTLRKSEKRNSTQPRKSHKSRDSSSESDDSCLESQKQRHRNWKDTQECYRCYLVGHNARYCPSTTVMESAAPTETAAAMTTSFENYWMTVMNA
jgi:hypothetical protein